MLVLLTNRAEVRQQNYDLSATTEIFVACGQSTFKELGDISLSGASDGMDSVSPTGGAIDVSLTRGASSSRDTSGLGPQNS